MTSEEARAFAEELALQGRLYEEVLELSKRQSALLHEPFDEDRLNALIEEKEGKMSRIAAMEADLAERKALWRRTKEDLPDEIRGIVGPAVEEMAGTLQALLEEEAKFGEVLLSLRGEAGRKLKELQEKRQINKAYSPPKPGGGTRFVDESR